MKLRGGDPSPLRVFSAGSASRQGRKHDSRRFLAAAIL